MIVIVIVTVIVIVVVDVAVDVQVLDLVEIVGVADDSIDCTEDHCKRHFARNTFGWRKR
jgi:hypothetical protein